MPAGQKLLELPVRVIDAEGKPVAKAKVIPWALRSSQGHGWWKSGDKVAGVGPNEVVTDENGLAVVVYPQYRDVREHIRTIEVTLSVDHPEFAYVGNVYIEVPLEARAPYEIKLTRGVSLEIRPLIDHQPADLNDSFVLWSDGRSWNKGFDPRKPPTARFACLSWPGKNSVLLVKLDGDRPTYFSKITDVDLEPDTDRKLEIELHPSLPHRGDFK